MTPNLIPIPPKSDLKQLYITEMKSSYYIGAIYNCSTQTVLKWLRHYSIPVRGRGQYGSPRKTVCDILTEHSTQLKHDPNKLSSEFLLGELEKFRQFKGME